MNVLLLDIGNCRIKWGLLEDGVIGHTGVVSHDSILEQRIPGLTSQLPRQVDAAFASNVAGASFALQISEAIRSLYDCELQFAESEQQSNGVTNGYQEPVQLGVDRWLAMIAARAETKACCLVVDAGTAITIDVLSDKGQHLGGQILPGLRLISEALSNQTSDIEHVDTVIDGGVQGLNMFANNTDGAVRLGATNAILGAIERSIRVLSTAGQDATIFLTGGDAPQILPSLSGDVLHRPHLVLQGLAHILLNCA